MTLCSDRFSRVECHGKCATPKGPAPCRFRIRVGQCFSWESARLWSLQPLEMCQPPGTYSISVKRYPIRVATGGAMSFATCLMPLPSSVVRNILIYAVAHHPGEI